MIKQLPTDFLASHKSDAGRQFAALCYRIKRNKLEILLVTARGSGRWILPKGWPIDGLTPAGSAAQEAWEEAGVKGEVSDRCLGLYSYSKPHAGAGLPIMVMIYPVRVDELADDFPEAGQRMRKWFGTRKAAAKVLEPELSRILKDFDPGMLA